MINRDFIFFILFVLIGTLTSCYKEEVISTDFEGGPINFYLEDHQIKEILEVRGKETIVDNPYPQLLNKDKFLTTTKFKTRGETTLQFQRKSFNVHLREAVGFFNPEKKFKYLYEFKLLSLSMDYTYINNKLSYDLFSELKLWPLLTFFTEVRLNDNTQGLYLFVEDPVEYSIKELNSPCILRRTYNHGIKKISLNDKTAENDESFYKSFFTNIYSIIIDYKGEELYQQLSNHLDLEQYFQKIAVDYLLKNGDYTDELWFYIKEKNGKQVFGVIPWDYDDTFSANPHEVGRSWAVGTAFGKRVYQTIDDVNAVIGNKIFFSIEDDLDYAIVNDSILYIRYLIEFKKVIDILNNDIINKTFDKLKEDLTPFFQNNEIVAQSQYDLKESDMKKFLDNLDEKRSIVISRREESIKLLRQANIALDNKKTKNGI